MMFRRNLVVAALVALVISFPAFGNLTPEQQQAKVRGGMLFNQYKIAEPDLRIAAEAGDSEAQYYLAEEFRQMNRYITPDAQKWYEAAAAQGNYYAMFQLAGKGSDLCTVIGNCTVDSKTPGEWMELIWDTAKPLADKGDREAMKILYNATGDLEWLEKSAEAGYPVGQFWLAVQYRQGEGFFLLPWERSSAVEKWFKASAEGGYPPGMMEYVSILYEDGDMEGVRYWTEKAAEAGLVGAVSNYGAYLSHEPDRIGYPLDLVKGYALISLLKELDGGGNIQVYVESKLPRIAAKMTPEQIEQAKKFAEKWKATHPPLSFFPHKLGY